MKTLLVTLLALAILPVLSFGQQPTMAQERAAAVSAPPPNAAALQKLASSTAIELSPPYLHPGNDAVLLIVSPYQKGATHPVRLNPVLKRTAITTIKLFNYENRYIANTPDSLEVTVYHIVLNANSYTFTPNDFINLPPGFKFPKLTIKRVNP